MDRIQRFSFVVALGVGDYEAGAGRVGPTYFAGSRALDVVNVASDIERFRGSIGDPA